MSGEGGNVARAGRVLEELAALGMREACVCAGARNAPFIAAFAGSSVRPLPFFEERSAAFFALGRARRDRRPVGVVVTSGTAAAELLPACVEAKHSGVPLALITADRPSRLRGTGAPQTIDQQGLFKGFVDVELDLEGDMPPGALAGWNRRAPVHLNVSFDEPLIDGPAPRRAGAPELRPKAPAAFDEPAARAAADALSRARRPVVVISGLETAEERAAAKRLALRLGVPVYAEGASGLREDAELEPILLRSGDRLLSWAYKSNLFDCVFRIGGVPTARLWRDLEAPSRTTPVASISSLPYPGLSRCAHASGDLEAISNYVAERAEPRAGDGQLLAKDREAARALTRALDEHPSSEPSFVRAISRAMGDDSGVYLGNSLPIREWDLAADRARPRWARASRGANGIDGQVSTFLGGAGQGAEEWALLGDLTALYDLAGPWAAPYVESRSTKLVVLNNGGGKIFSRIFGDAMFENRHSLRFDAFAKAWNLRYERWTHAPVRVPAVDGLELIEAIPDADQTSAFWTEHDAIWSDRA